MMECNGDFKYGLRQQQKLVLTFILLVCASSSSTVNARGIQHHTFPNHKQGEFVKQLQSYHIAVPTKVRDNGEHITHDLHHSFHVNHIQKRDTAAPTDDMVHYNIQLNDKKVHVRLRPNHKIVSPGMVIETRGNRFGNMSDVTIRRFPKSGRCQYIGDIKDHPGSVVAMTTCKGLTGYLRTNEGDYFIEPVKDHDLNKDPHHPHLIYKRSALPDELSGIHVEENHPEDGACGVKGGHASPELQRERWERRRRSTQGHHRKKRSISLERHVETLIVADPKMTEFYQDEDIETYILTVMNMVVTMYHDASVGNAVNIVLVKILLLQEDQENLKIVHHADHTLQSFCRWQKRINPKNEKHPNHHDVAVLMTRKNICSRMNEPCSTLGLSQVSGLCQPHRSCNVNEDTGLALAYTVAHELGHNFGMHHDSPENGCAARPGELQHVMAPQLTAEAYPLIWSNCSRQSITQFLDRDWGYCLDDEPSEHDFEFPQLPPGAMYDADHQCRLQYGHSAEYCDGIDDLCSTIWCRVDNKCLTRLEAAAEGTMCGDNKWCYAGKCETIEERPMQNNGQWGQWGAWSECTRTCGAGIRLAERHCNNPPPSHGGLYCIGERKRYRICNTDNCPEGGKSFRHQQCAEFNYIPYKNGLHQWEPSPTIATPCQLHCKPLNKYFSVMLRDVVADGTPCRTGSRDMCISGNCRHIGCDWHIDSAAKEDRCGVCHGDGTTCTTVKQEFKDKQGLGYVEATVIPEGARNIRVEEVAEANNYLAVMNDKGEYYLNGHWFIQWSGEYKAGGTVINYERQSNKETFTATGPLKEPLHIMLLFQSENPGLKFEYTVPNANASLERKLEFRWVYQDWSHCTSSCGGGVQRSIVVCLEKEAGLVEDKHCNISTKPDDKSKPCNDHLCPARWWIGPWQHCSVTCGKNGIHRRTVICVRSLGYDEQVALEDHECEGAEKPLEEEACHHKEACVENLSWSAGKWSDTCEGDKCDVQTRSVKCHAKDGACPEEEKPEESRYCSNVSCGQWSIQEWSKCSRSCEGGVQFRQVICEGGQYCRSKDRPPHEQDCNIQSCVSNKINVNLHGDTEKSPSNNKEHGIETNKVDEDKKVNGTDVEKSKGAVKINKNKNKKSSEPDGVVTGSGDVDGKESNQTTKAPNKIKYVWKALDWQKCTKHCGKGLRQRPVLCVEESGVEALDRSLCSQRDRPALVEECNTEPCLEWEATGWSECSATCGRGIQHRFVTCPKAHHCMEEGKPSLFRHCENGPCIVWVAGSWSQCSLSCGGGEQVRHVQCINSTSDQPSSGCDEDLKPNTTLSCNNHPCPTVEAALQKSQFKCVSNKMSYPVCKALKRMGQCKTRFVELKCCKTCEMPKHSPDRPTSNKATSNK